MKQLQLPFYNKPYMGFAEVTEYLGISKQVLCNWRKRSVKKHTLPEPVEELAMGPVWRTEDIVQFKVELMSRTGKSAKVV